MLNQFRSEFLNPAEEYTPIPFWFWNGDLKEKEIIRQIQDFKNKGIDGVVIHPRMGIPEQIEYLSDPFMELVKCAVSKAAELGMKVVLYDEGMYPSGSAHGMVVKSNPCYASRGLKMLEHKSCSGSELHTVQSALGSLVFEEGEVLVAAIALPITEASSDGGMPVFRMDNCQVLYPVGGNMGQGDTVPAGITDDPIQWEVYLFVETYTKGHIRGVHFGEDDGEPGAPPSADLLNPEAMKRFVHFTHERYFQVLREFFSSTVIGMFTDEPAIMGRGSQPGLIPWTSGFLDWYLSRGGRICDLPALWVDSENAQEIRALYKKAVHERLELSYYQPISQWCEEHGIALMGHPEASDDIGILAHFHVPGQDVVWRWVAPENGTALDGVHSTQAKCSSDAARHRGRRRNSNECFGCCGPNGIQWAFSMDDMKWYMDWLFVRGVNLLIPHAFFYSIEGEKRLDERPPDVGPNNLWWPYYSSISKYIKRMSWLMTDSVNVTSVAVLCEANHLPWKIARPLFENQIEFIYLEENLLTVPDNAMGNWTLSVGDTAIKNSAVIKDGYIYIHKQRYNVLIIEDSRSLQPALTEKLQKFLDTGGNIILYHSDLEETGLKGVHKIENIGDVVPVLDSVMERDAVLYFPSESLRLSHVVKEGVHFYLLVNEGEEPVVNTISIGFTGEVEQWDGWSGEVKQVQPEWKEKGMAIPFCLERRQSLILVVQPSCYRKPILEKTADQTFIKNLDLIKSGTKAPDTCKKNIREEQNSKESRYTLMQTLENGWSLYNGQELLYPDFKLCSWTVLPGMKDFSGTLTYMHLFTLDLADLTGGKVYLDLGNVYNLVEILVNDEPAGLKMWGPYVFDISDYVQDGENNLFVKVTNTLANRISKAELTSGLIGPVKITASELSSERSCS